LATASLEDRPVLVFDEWAAEQDPTFKRIFYRVILPALQQEGRTIIVVTHDEAHLDVADQVVKLEDGQVASRARKAVSSLALA
jgi:putative ATP-binding cassette transporter